MPDMSNEFPSKWLRAADVTRPVTLTIRSVSKEQVGQSQQWVLYFNKANKGYVLKAGVNAALCSAFGRNSDSWVGKRVQLSPTTVKFGGQFVPSIAVQPVTDAPATAAQTAPPPTANVGAAVDDAFGDDDVDGLPEDAGLGDDIPF